MKNRSPSRAAVAALVVVALGLTASSALARMGRRGGPDSYAGLERGLAELSLDDATLQSVYGILDAARDERRAVRSRLFDAERAMRDLLEQETPDVEAVLQQADVVGAIRSEVHKQRLKALLQIQALLTPEQRARFREHVREKWGDRRGRRGHEPCGGPPPR